MPAADVVNKSRMSAKYSRSAKGRVEQATARDPTAYALHKRGAPGADIQCDCGVTLKNTKQARAYHSNKNKTHQAWLLSLTSSGLSAEGQGSSPDDDSSCDNGESPPNRAHQVLVLRFLFV